jgi:hypothetical protein
MSFWKKGLKEGRKEAEIVRVDLFVSGENGKKPPALVISACFCQADAPPTGPVGDS